jgi:hypothetical protein
LFKSSNADFIVGNFLLYFLFNSAILNSKAFFFCFFMMRSVAKFYIFCLCFFYYLTLNFDTPHILVVLNRRKCFVTPWPAFAAGLSQNWFSGGKVRARVSRQWARGAGTSPGRDCKAPAPGKGPPSCRTRTGPKSSTHLRTDCEKCFTREGKLIFLERKSVFA